MLRPTDGLQRLAAGLAQLLHRLPQQARVEVKADGGDVPMLLGAQNLASAANLHIAHGHPQARAQL